MGRFWKFKSEKPLVWNYYGWYYGIEYYGIRHIFIDIEQLRERRNDIAERKGKSVGFSNSFWSIRGLAIRMYVLRERYIHFRHREEIVNLFEQAYEQFSTELDT